MSTLVRTKEDKAFDLDDITEVQLFDSSIDVSGWKWAWIVLWLIFFLPIGLFLLWYYTRNKKYTCAVKFNKSRRVYTFDKTNYYLLATKEDVH